MTSNDSTIVLITGANAGIGFTVVKALCDSPSEYTILLGSRDKTKGEAAVSQLQTSHPHTKSTIHLVELDITSDESITRALDHISSVHGHIDVLVNNAGAAFDAEVQPSNLSSIRSAWDRAWSVNVASTQVLTEATMPLLIQSRNPRLIFLASGAASLTETIRTDGPMYERLNAAPPAGWPKVPAQGAVHPSAGAFRTSSYRTSKAGLNMLMREWARLLRNDGVKVWAISPGFLATGLGGSSGESKKAIGAGDAQVGGDFIRDVIEGKRDEDVGRVIRTTMVQPW